MKTIWRCEHWPWATIVFHTENIVVGIVFLIEELSMFLSIFIFPPFVTFILFFLFHESYTH